MQIFFDLFTFLLLSLVQGAGLLIHTTFLIFTRGLEQLQKILRVIHNFLSPTASNPRTLTHFSPFSDLAIGSVSRVPEAVLIIRK